MKGIPKFVFCVCLAIGLVIAFTGCASTGADVIKMSTHYQNKSVPWQEQALIMPLPPRNGNRGLVDIDGIPCTYVGVIPAGRRTLNVTIEIFQGIWWSFQTGGQASAQITYDFKPGERYVLYGSLKKFLGGYGINELESVNIITLAEYYALPNVSKAEKKWKNEDIPRNFARAEAELNARYGSSSETKVSE